MTADHTSRTFLISLPRFVPGRALGGEVYVSGLLTGLGRLKTQHRLVVLASEASTSWIRDRWPSLDLLSVPTGRSGVVDLLSGRTVASAAHAIGAHAVMFPLNLGHDVTLPTLLYVHDFVAHFYRRRFPRFQSVRMRIQGRLLVRAIRSATSLACPSGAVADELHELHGIPRDRVTVIYEAPLLGASRHAPDDVLARVAGRPFVLQAGSSLPHKNHAAGFLGFTLARRHLVSLGIDPVLVITGDTETSYRTLHAAGLSREMEGAVVFAGRRSREQQEWLMAHAYCHLMPTLYEGFGLGLIEAQALGRPVAASDIPVLREVADGQAVFFDPASPDDISRALLRLFTDRALWERLSQAGRTAVSRLSWDAHAAQVVGLLERISPGSGAERRVE